MKGTFQDVLSLESAVAICIFLDPVDAIMWSMTSFTCYDFFNDDEIWKVCDLSAPLLLGCSVSFAFWLTLRPPPCPLQTLYFRRWNHHPDMPQKIAVLKKSSTRHAGKTRLVSTPLLSDFSCRTRNN